MTQATTWLPAGLLAGLLAALVLTPGVRAGGEIGFTEDFALAKDRAVPLAQLIPGTEDFYYYHALHLLNTEQFDKVEDLTRPWLERHGRTSRLVEIETRNALLTYEKNPKRSLDYLRSRLGLQFNHERETLGAPPNLPITLDAKLISRATLKANSFARWTNLDNFEDSALDWLAPEELTWERRRNLLQRLQRPDVPNLPKLVFDDLESPHPQSFGAYAVHNMMTIPQLDDLLKLKGDLLNHSAFVRAWASKLQPGADSDWRRNRAEAKAYLERLQAFVSRLAPVHNPLKAHVLYHRLALDRAEGVYDKDRFLSYLKLPRQQGYMAKALLEAEESRRYPADLNANFDGVTLLPPVRGDEELVRGYLQHFFAEAANTKEFEPYINDVYLTHLFAETKAELGLGDPETWASLLPPERFKQFKDRVDIDFAATNKTDFGADEAVSLDLFVKNVPNLIVKVFEVNTGNFYRKQLKEVDTDLNLDGLVPNVEKSNPYTESPLRRMSRRFAFPELNQPGVYVIDFIGSGKSSRALIRKGRLRPIVATGPAGQEITVVDEAGKPVPKAGVWLGGTQYIADEKGTAVVPYSAQPGRRPIVMSRGEFACLDTIAHQPENYALTAGIYVDRESLLTQREAQILIRPALTLNGIPISLKLLENAKLRITSTDQSGIVSATEVPEFKLFEDRESIHEIRTPARLAHLMVQLTAEVKSLSLNQPVALAASESFSLNQIDTTDKIEDLHLARFGSDTVIELLGRTGESKADRPVNIQLKHRDFREPVNVTLKSDPAGRINLGPLTDILTVTATGPEGTGHTWHLPADRHTYRATLHAKSGEVISVPYLGSAAKASRAEFALFEMRSGAIAADRFDALAINGSMLELRGLTSGDYELWLKTENHRIRIRVTDGPVVDGTILGKLRFLQLPGLKPVQIASVSPDGDSIVVKLADASKFTRVHLFATRYRPAFSAYGNLGKVRAAELSGVIPTQPESAYLTGRNIGDEYRYVLDRRGMRKFPGNMLERPMLLLNPWAVRSTETGEQQAQQGDAFDPRGEAPKSAPLAPPMRPSEPGMPPGGGDFANLDYLMDSSAVVVNLVPDKNGEVRIPRARITPHSMVQVVAVDPVSTTARTVSLPEQPAKFVDLRLRDGLDPNGFFTQQKQVTVIPAGQAFTIADAAASRFEAYDSLGRAYGLFTTLNHDPKYAEFAFVTGWNKLKPEEKREQYSKFASHELHVFLWKKDPEFFNSVVKPFLANKKDKTFLDHFLLGDDLKSFLDPWAYTRLNTVEKVLLAQRIGGEPAKTVRLLDDLLKLQPPRPELVMMLFDTAVKGGEMEKGNAWAAAPGKKLKAELDDLQRLPNGRPGNVPLPGLAGGAPPSAQAPMQDSGISGRGVAERKSEMDMKQREGRSAGKDMAKEQLAADKSIEELQKSLQDEQLYFRQDLKRAEIRQLYRRLDPTMEWAENNYHHLRIVEQNGGLVGVSPFWLDYAKHDGKGPFLSKHLAAAARNFPEAMLALSVLDLPFEAGKHDIQFADNAMTVKPAGPVIAFHEEVRKADGPDGKVPVLVGQNIYRNGDRYREENGERVDKYVSGEFLVHTVYGCQVVVTNPTSARQRLSVLVQLPIGAMPLGNAQFTRTILLDLEPYRTQTVDYLFYFPKAGKYPHFPAQVAKAERVVAAAKPITFDVVEKPTKLDTESWDYVSQFGTEDAVIALMMRENVHALNLNKIAFRMKDRAFFDRTITVLKDRHVYNPVLWSYGIYHNIVAAAREFLTHSDQLANECGGPIDTPLFTLNPVARHTYEHLEYKPLVNARAHSLGSRRQIVNGAFYEQYHKLTKQLTYSRGLNDTQLLAVTYYLILQDRVEEAQSSFERVVPGNVATQIQYDYCAAYLAMYAEDLNKARSIAMKYTGHPVDRWRNTFAAIIATLDEAAGKGAQLVNAEDAGQRQGQLAATEPGFEVALDGAGVRLSWQNLTEVQVNYYLMDVELLFSRSPFAQQGGAQFAFTKPNAMKTVKLPAKESKLALALPPELAKRNVLVEVSAAGKTQAVPFYASAMTVQMLESYGQVRVTDAASSKPLSKVYVKVYSKHQNGTVKFHKDGYTDIRGRFDYASVSTPESSPVVQYSVLVLSDDRGAVIREVTPPQQ